MQSREGPVRAGAKYPFRGLNSVQGVRIDSVLILLKINTEYRLKRIASHRDAALFYTVERIASVV